MWVFTRASSGCVPSGVILFFLQPPFFMKSESPALQSADKPSLRVVLVDDHVSMRQMLGVVLRLDGGVEVVGEASGGV